MTVQADQKLTPRAQDLFDRISSTHSKDIADQALDRAKKMTTTKITKEILIKALTQVIRSQKDPSDYFGWGNTYEYER